VLGWQRQKWSNAVVAPPMLFEKTEANLWL